MLDETNEETDERIATHIVQLHRNPDATVHSVPFTMEHIQRYIRYARAIKPFITPEVGTLHGPHQQLQRQALWYMCVQAYLLLLMVLQWALTDC